MINDLIYFIIELSILFITTFIFLRYRHIYNLRLFYITICVIIALISLEFSTLDSPFYIPQLILAGASVLGLFINIVRASSQSKDIVVIKAGRISQKMTKKHTVIHDLLITATYFFGGLSFVHVAIIFAYPIITLVKITNNSFSNALNNALNHEAIAQSVASNYPWYYVCSYYFIMAMFIGAISYICNKIKQRYYPEYDCQLQLGINIDKAKAAGCEVKELSRSLMINIFRYNTFTLLRNSDDSSEKENEYLSYLTHEFGQVIIGNILINRVRISERVYAVDFKGTSAAYYLIKYPEKDDTSSGDQSRNEIETKSTEGATNHA